MAFIEAEISKRCAPATKYVSECKAALIDKTAILNRASADGTVRAVMTDAGITSNVFGHAALAQLLCPDNPMYTFCEWTKTKRSPAWRVLLTPYLRKLALSVASSGDDDDDSLWVHSVAVVNAFRAVSVDENFTHRAYTQVILDLHRLTSTIHATYMDIVVASRLAELPPVCTACSSPVNAKTCSHCGVDMCASCAITHTEANEEMYPIFLYFTWRCSADARASTLSP